VWALLVTAATVLIAATPAAAGPAADATLPPETPPSGATVPLPVNAVLPGDQQTSVVVDLSASTRAGTKSAVVTTDGVQRPATLVPLMSEGLSVTIVVDTATADAAAVPAWLSAGARFILEAPTGTRATVIGDSAPASVIAPPQQGPSGIVAALDGAQAHGDRDTAAALALAAKQFPDVPAGRKLTVVYTGAADAGGPTSTELAAEFRAAGVILVVATTADASPYWTSAAEGTGGFFAPAGHPVVVPALDQITTTLRGRYLARFPTPGGGPATVNLQVTTPDLNLAAEVALPGRAARPSAGRSDGALIVVLSALAVILAALVVAAALIALARRRHRPPPIIVAHGRATVPPAPQPPEI
jgi:hypothetical protein